MNYPDITSIENCPKEEIEKFIKNHCSRVHILVSERKDSKEVVELFSAMADDKCPKTLYVVRIITRIDDDRGFLTAIHSLYFNFDIEPSLTVEESL